MKRSCQKESNKDVRGKKAKKTRDHNTEGKEKNEQKIPWSENDE